MKLYWYKLGKYSITEEEIEVKETAKLYKSLSRSNFPYGFRSTLEKTLEGKVLKDWQDLFVFLAEKNLKKARDLFVEYQSGLIKRKNREIEKLETEIEEIERLINRLEDMEVYDE